MSPNHRFGAKSIIVTLLLLLLAGAGGALTAPRSASALTNCTIADYGLDGEESAFLGLINNYRAQNGLPALTISTNLNRSSAWLAVDMATKNYFSHTDSLGRASGQRATDCGYPGGAGENLAAGTLWDTAQEAFDAWRNSAGHNGNMLNGAYKQIGIARYWGAGSTYGWYWVTDLGVVDDGTGGGTVTPPPPVTTKAAITSPAPGSTLPGSSATFSWSAGSGALEYFFYAGTSAGSNNLYGQSRGLNLSVTLANLPTNGSTIYVRLWTRFASGWQFTDYTYRAATVAPAAAKAAIVSPAPGALLPAGMNRFTWNAGSGAQEYFFYMGTSLGSNNLYGQSMGLNQGVSVNVPAHTGAIYVRLWTRLATGWQFTDYSYR